MRGATKEDQRSGARLIKLCRAYGALFSPTATQGSRPGLHIFPPPAVVRRCIFRLPGWRVVKTDFAFFEHTKGLRTWG